MPVIVVAISMMLSAHVNGEGERKPPRRLDSQGMEDLEREPEDSRDMEGFERDYSSWETEEFERDHFGCEDDDGTAMVEMNDGVFSLRLLLDKDGGNKRKTQIKRPERHGRGEKRGESDEEGSESEGSHMRERGEGDRSEDRREEGGERDMHVEGERGGKRSEDDGEGDMMEEGRERERGETRREEDGERHMQGRKREEEDDQERRERGDREGEGRIEGEGRSQEEEGGRRRKEDGRTEEGMMEEEMREMEEEAKRMEEEGRKIKEEADRIHEDMKRMIEEAIRGADRGEIEEQRKGMLEKVRRMEGEAKKLEEMGKRMMNGGRRRKPPKRRCGLLCRKSPSASPLDFCINAPCKEDGEKTGKPATIKMIDFKVNPTGSAKPLRLPCEDHTVDVCNRRGQSLTDDLDNPVNTSFYQMSCTARFGHCIIIKSTIGIHVLKQNATINGNQMQMNDIKWDWQLEYECNDCEDPEGSCDKEKGLSASLMLDLGSGEGEMSCEKKGAGPKKCGFKGDSGKKGGVSFDENVSYLFLFRLHK